MQKFANEQQMIDFGKALAKTIKIPAVIELVGDVGAGKTTITKGLAQGLRRDHFANFYSLQALCFSSRRERLFSSSL